MRLEVDPQKLSSNKTHKSITMAQVAIAREDYTHLGIFTIILYIVLMAKNPTKFSKPARCLGEPAGV